MAIARHRSSATPLALAYAALVVYASLYPFAGWRWPPGQHFGALALLPWTRWRDTYDVVSNLLGYLPLGALLCIATRRAGMRALPSLLLTLALAACLSYLTELLQQFLPRRVPAMEDWLMNIAGALAGALTAMAGHALGLVGRWQALRARWFVRDSAGAIALLALWPVGLLFPTTVPLGLGQVAERLREALADGLEDVPWAETAYELLSAPLPATTALRPLGEVGIIGLGLLAPCLVAYSIIPAGWRRAVSAVGAAVVGVAGMTLSTWLNFGPAHALAWLGPTVVPGLAMGLVVALLLVPLPRRIVAGLGLVAVTGLVVAVAQAPADPYFAQNLQAWEQGRFVRFHGLAQWVGWLWPYAALLWLLTQLGTRREG